jgi:hypothetical protein
MKRARAAVDTIDLVSPEPVSPQATASARRRRRRRRRRKMLSSVFNPKGSPGCATAAQQQGSRAGHRSSACWRVV